MIASPQKTKAQQPNPTRRYQRARWYDSENGRWISEDPLGFAAGDANLARYVGNGGINATDPSGLVEAMVGLPVGGKPVYPIDVEKNKAGELVLTYKFGSPFATAQTAVVNLDKAVGILTPGIDKQKFAAALAHNMIVKDLKTFDLHSRTLPDVDFRFYDTEEQLKAADPKHTPGVKGINTTYTPPGPIIIDAVDDGSFMQLVHVLIHELLHDEIHGSGDAVEGLVERLTQLIDGTGSVDIFYPKQVAVVLNAEKALGESLLKDGTINQNIVKAVEGVGK